MNRRIDLDKLSKLVELSKTGQFGRAAANLGISQPALTQSMKKLEQEFEVKLLTRHSRGMVLTEPGRELVQLAYTIANSIERIQAGEGADNATNVHLIGIPLSLGPTVIHPIYEEVRSQWPDDKVEFVEATTAFLEQATASGRIDLALLYDSPKMDEIVAVPILTESLMFVYPPVWGLELADGPLRFRGLSQFPLILPGQMQSERRVIRTAEARMGHILRPRLEIDLPLTISALVNSGFGGTVGTQVAFGEDIRMGRLLMRPISGPLLSTTLAIAAYRNRRYTNRMPSIILAIQKRIFDLVSDDLWPGATLLPS